MRLRTRGMVFLMLVSVLVRVCAARSDDLSAQSAPPGPESLGRSLFSQVCGPCHESGKAPIKDLLMMMTPNAIYDVMTKGAMRVQASQLTDEERRQVVRYLAGREPEKIQTRLPMCDSRQTGRLVESGPIDTGWGIEPGNTRLVPPQLAGLTVGDLRGLELRWTFAFPDSIESRSQPTIVGSTLYVGSESGALYALDAGSGCVRWVFNADGEIRGAPVYRTEAVVDDGKVSYRPILYVGDVFAHAYAVDARTGTVLWKEKIDDHPAARIVGTPLVTDNRVYLPLGSWGEEIAAAAPDYVCCTFRGSMVALQRSSGALVWKRYTIPTAAVVQYENSIGKPHLGPSGAGIWSSPTLDAKRRKLYFTTGNNFSDPADDNSDAVFAVDAESGNVVWKRQTIANDTFNSGCSLPRAPTCPKHPGPDNDYTAPPILLHERNGKDILLAGQKSGDAFGLDPDTGAILWHTRLGNDREPLRDAIWFGMTATQNRLIVPVIAMSLADQAPASSLADAYPLTTSNGLYALNPLTGEILWSTPSSGICSASLACAGVAMAPIAIVGAVFAGTIDGWIRVFDTHRGKLLWSFNTAREFNSVSGDIVRGGAIRGAGSIMIAKGMLYVICFDPQAPGSVLMAFSSAKRQVH